MPSPITVQIFVAIIGFCCITYSILLIYYPSSFKYIIGKGYFPSEQKILNISSNTFNCLAVQNTLNCSGTLRNESFICDNITQNNQYHVLTNVSFEKHRINALRPYCDIVPTPRNKWISAKRYVESDIVFIIYTGAGFYHTRATAVRDTWLSRVTHKYFFSATPYSPLPITVIEGAGESYLSSIPKLYKGMQIAYREHNGTAKFYYLAGCDTFVNVPHILKRLDEFDYKKPYIIGGHPYSHPCYKSRNIVSTISYPSGGAGFFLSGSAVEMLYPKLDSFFKNDWPSESAPYSDVALNCLAQSMGLHPSLVPGFWPTHPEDVFKGVGRQKFHSDPEPNNFHYVSPTLMYNLDEFYVFQHIDRLANDNNLVELVKFTRKFVAAHYELLRIKINECTLPAVKSTQKRK